MGQSERINGVRIIYTGGKRKTDALPQEVNQQSVTLLIIEQNGCILYSVTGTVKLYFS